MNKNNIIKFMFTGLVLIGITALGIFLWHLYQKPLGQPLALVTRPAIKASPISMPTLPASTPAVITPEPTLPPVIITSTPINDQVCGQVGAMNLLIIGSDAEDLRGRPGSDLTRIARIDFSHKYVSIFALPRNLWVDVTVIGFDDPLITETILGEVYYEAHERSIQLDQSGRMTDGAQASAQMILDNFGVSTNHYIVVDLFQLPALIDAIGGVPINVPERTTDPWIGSVIQAGPQILNGEQLKDYARAIPDSDFDRIQRNNIILYALRQKLLDPEVWIRLPLLYERFHEIIATDLSPELIVSLLCLIDEVPREEIRMEGVEPEWTSTGPLDSLLWDSNLVRQALEQLGLLP